MLSENVIKPFRDAPTDVEFDSDRQEVTVVIFDIGDGWVDEYSFPLELDEARKLAHKILDTCSFLSLDGLLSHPQD